MYMTIRLAIAASAACTNRYMALDNPILSFSRIMKLVYCLWNSAANNNNLAY